MPTRDEVYKAIDSERNYQDRRWGDPGQRGKRSIDEFALYIGRYASKLEDVATTAENPKDKLEVIRKIAALCTACMEQHGTPIRDLSE